MRAFDDAGVPLQAIDIPETAQRNVARLLEAPGRALALLVFDAEDPLLTFTAGGELYQHRRIELQARVDGIDDAGQSRAFYERLVLELQRSLDQFGRQYPALAISRMLVSSVSGADDLVPQLAGGLALPVAALDLTRVVDCTRVPELAAPGRQTQCLHLLGAALREATANAAVQPLRRAS
jgi:MSHA biogenesis protein MshI